MAVGSKSVLIVDTDILCVWLKIPGFDSCGPDVQRWDFPRIDGEITTALELHFTLVLPLATIIETGNHIAHAAELRRERALDLANLMRKAADETTPWAAFTEQAELWSGSNLKTLAEVWPDLAATGLTIGDATIKDVAEYYSAMGFVVRRLSGDTKLAAYEPPHPRLVPRRRQRVE
jgi:hypothetical protein